MSNYSIDFDSEVWLTPNTYGGNFKPFPHAPGVYVILHFDLKDYSSEILYIGCAKNLANRIRSHEVHRFLHQLYRYLPVYFLECEDYRDVEKYLISKYKPRFNKQHIN